jgi:DNA (cytosine-5)-methyltransferase 1
MSEARAAYTTDNLTPEQRRRAMRAVKRRDTAPELALRKALTGLGVRGYRVDRAGLPGRPDIAFGRDKLAVFVDGGFWHGRADRVREGRSPYWDNKIAGNVARDRRVDQELEASGWRILRLWDDEVLQGPEVVARRIYRRLHPRPVAEFFAGIGLVRLALEDAGLEVVFANDIEPAKRHLYASNFDSTDFRLCDVRDVHGADVPDVRLATASFPCTDLSLAGWRRGLRGEHSSMFWEFCRVIDEMGSRKPMAIMLENVPSFATSHGGEDLRAAIAELNRLGYRCDVLQLDARHWVPQSRPRVFIVGSQEPLAAQGAWQPCELRPAWIRDFVSRHPELDMQAMPLTMPTVSPLRLADIVERIPADDPRWWDATRLANFMESLSAINKDRLRSLMSSKCAQWRTAYRRTRGGRAVWEVRADEISGCLRTARGGSSKQALVETKQGSVRVRWMTPREYARLMGAPDYVTLGVSDNQALFGFGDAVCVPAVAWLAQEYLAPLAHGELTRKEPSASLSS